VRLPLLFVLVARGVVGQVDVGLGLPFLYHRHGHVGHWPCRGGAKILDPLTRALQTRFSPAVPMRDFMPLALVVDLACWDYLVPCSWLCNKSVPGHE
jgi:hypothetical protein